MSKRKRGDVGTVTKRVKVSISNPDEPQDPEAIPAIADKEQRNKCIKFLLTGAANLASPLSLIENLRSDISVGMGLTSIFSAAHEALRKIANGSKTDEDYESLSLEIVLDKQYTISHSEARRILKEAANQFGLQYTKATKTTPNHWYGTMSPIINFVMGFKLRLTELRLGHYNIVVGVNKATNTVKEVKAEDVGFSNQHYGLLTGASYPPARKGAMTRSLGVGTQILMCAAHGKGMYGKKWVKACDDSISGIPEHDKITKCLSDYGVDECKPIIGALCDIILMTQSRAIRRANIPLTLLLYTMTSISEDGDKIILDNAVINDFAFSGRALFAWYHNHIPRDHKFKFRCALDKSHAAQVIFHSMFDTCYTDLGVLTSITDLGTWAYRSSISNLGGYGVNDPIDVVLIKFHYWSKLSSAQGGEIITPKFKQLVEQGPFAGYQEMEWGDDWFKYIASREERNVVSYDLSNPSSVAAYLSSLRSDLNRRVMQKRVTVRGNTHWHVIPREGKILPRLEPNQKAPDMVEGWLPEPAHTFFMDNQ